MRRGLLFSVLLSSSLFLGGCQSTVRLPLQTGWFEDRKVYYITTEASHLDVAREMNVNYAPRLAQEVPVYPKRPGQPTVLERVYGFPGSEQANPVFASIPEPVGPNSEDTNYSPLWLMYEVRWQLDAVPVLLTSEESILAAEEAGWVQVLRTNVVVNCPVLGTEN